MTTTAEQIVSEALTLPVQVRAFLAERLLESLDTEEGEELPMSWRSEIRRRCREVEDGAVELKEASKVFRKAYSALG